MSPPGAGVPRPYSSPPDGSTVHREPHHCQTDLHVHNDYTTLDNSSGQKVKGQRLQVSQGQRDRHVREKVSQLGVEPR